MRLSLAQYWRQELGAHDLGGRLRQVSVQCPGRAVSPAFGLSGVGNPPRQPLTRCAFGLAELPRIPFPRIRCLVPGSRCAGVLGCVPRMRCRLSAVARDVLCLWRADAPESPRGRSVSPPPTESPVPALAATVSTPAHTRVSVPVPPKSLGVPGASLPGLCGSAAPLRYPENRW